MRSTVSEMHMHEQKPEGKLTSSGVTLPLLLRTRRAASTASDAVLTLAS